jgi:hypothetical protein
MLPYEINKIQNVEIFAVTTKQIAMRGEIPVGDPYARMLVFVIDGVSQLFELKAITIPKEFGEALDRAVMVHKGLPSVTQAASDAQVPLPGSR